MIFAEGIVVQHMRWHFSFLARVSIALVLSACVLFTKAPAPRPVWFYGITPHPVYQEWLVEVQRCAVETAKIDSAFEVVRLLESIEEVTWMVVPTEMPDGTFQWPNGRFYYGMRVGPAGKDTIFLSGQGLLRKWLVKHELLHVIVDSPTETSENGHGRPWGFCEYV